MSNKLSEAKLRIISGTIIVLAILASKNSIYKLITAIVIISEVELINVTKKSKSKLISIIIAIYLIISWLCLLQIKKLLSFIICVFITDTSSFIVGKTIKGAKAFKEITPNKTISGYLGGIFFGAIAFYANIYAFECEKFIFAILTSIFTTIGSQTGDLLASYVKRRLNIKDFSKAIPGHGGFLDRFDSLYLSSIFYCILSWWK